MTEKTIRIKVAGFTIQLFSEVDFILEDGYLPFVCNINEIAPDVTVHCFMGIPESLFRKTQLVFEATSEHMRLYSIYQFDTNLGFVIYDQHQPDTIQQIAILDESFTQWKVYMLPSIEDNNKLVPLKYPLGPIIMHYLTLKSESVMIHASCIYDGEKGRIFSGFSGAGKSTMSKIWSEAGCGVVNDDRLIIRKCGDKFKVYNTPMYYSDIPKEAPLNSIYLISHSHENKVKRLSGALAISKVLAFCIQNNFDKRFIQNRLSFFSELCARIPVYDLGFVPDQKVVDFIKANENGQPE